MIRAVINFFKAINDWGDYTQRKYVEHASQMSYWPQLFLVLAVFGIPWLLAWHGDIIAPWMASVLGVGPYDIESAAKIRWRRTWSSAFCGPIITYYVIKFARNRHKLHKENKRSKE